MKEFKKDQSVVVNSLRCVVSDPRPRIMVQYSSGALAYPLIDAVTIQPDPPKFKVGDILLLNDDLLFSVSEVTETMYVLRAAHYCFTPTHRYTHKHYTKVGELP